MVFVQDPLGNLEALIRLGALWVGYLAVTELLRLVRAVAARADRRRARWPRIAIVGGALVVILALVTTAFVLTSRSAKSYAEEAGAQRCNGDASLCDLTLDQVTFAGSHNSMSSSQYPGFLFAEQIGTIGSQLNAGVRAFLIDTHYGVPSTSRVPGSSAALVITDRTGPAPDTGEAGDSASAERASRLAARAQRAADARRDIYLCHNHCELGAVVFSSVLQDVSTFLDTHPDEVVMLVIQDGTSPADTAAAIEAGGTRTTGRDVDAGCAAPDAAIAHRLRAHPARVLRARDRRRTALVPRRVRVVPGDPVHVRRQGRLQLPPEPRPRRPPSSSSTTGSRSRPRTPGSRRR